MTLTETDASYAIHWQFSTGERSEPGLIKAMKSGRETTDYW